MSLRKEVSEGKVSRIIALAFIQRMVADSGKLMTVTEEGLSTDVVGLIKET